jgi:hypothetical protein
MRRREYKCPELRKHMDSPEEQEKTAEKFRLFCERATAKNKEWDDFGATDVYKLVALLEPDFDSSRIKTAVGNWKTISKPNKDGTLSPSYYTTNALKKLFISSLHFETPECDEGGMPTSGHSFRTRYLNAHLDRKINELKELEEMTTEDGIGKKLDESLTENAKLRIKIDELEREYDELEREYDSIEKKVKEKDVKINSMIPKSHWKMMEEENKQLNKLIEKLGQK